MCQASTFNDLQRKLPIISRSIPKKKTDQPSPNTQRMRSIEKREKSSLKLMKELKTEKKKHQIRVEKSQAEFDARVKAEADKRLEQMSNFYLLVSFLNELLPSEMKWLKENREMFYCIK